MEILARIATFRDPKTAEMRMKEKIPPKEVWRLG
jgi:hypothetical protein